MKQRLIDFLTRDWVWKRLPFRVKLWCFLNDHLERPDEA